MSKYHWISTGTWNLILFFLFFLTNDLFEPNATQSGSQACHSLVAGKEYLSQAGKSEGIFTYSPSLWRREGEHRAATPVRRHLIVKLPHHYLKYVSAPPSFKGQGIKQGISPLTSSGFRSMPPLCYKSMKPLWEALKRIAGYPIPTSCRRAVIWQSNCQFSIASVKQFSLALVPFIICLIIFL